MMRKNSLLASFLAVPLAVLLLLLPATSAIAQLNEQPEELLNAVSYIEFDARRSVHYLLSTSTPDLWDTETRVPDTAAESAGSFRLAKSLPLLDTSEAVLYALRERGVSRFDRQIVVGTLYALDGSERHVAGLKIDYALSGDHSDSSGSAIVPIFGGTDLGKLEQVADLFADRLLGRASPEADGFRDLGADGTAWPVAKSDCRGYCLEELGTDINLCLATSVACIGAVGTTALGCIQLCPLTGPGVLPCLLVCNVGNIFALALCLLNQHGCNRSARRNLDACTRACPPIRPDE